MTQLVVHTGIIFSQFEPSALVQLQGGPCAVLAPVQAFLLKNLLKQKKSEEWNKVRFFDKFVYVYYSVFYFPSISDVKPRLP